MKKLKIIIIIGIVFLILVISGIIILVNSKVFKETLIKRDLRKMTTEFYSIYYDEHNSNNEIKDLLKNYEKSGFTIKLSDLNIYLTNRTGVTTEYKSLEKCDISNTRVTIKPKKPFNKKDVELKFELSCKID